MQFIFKIGPRHCPDGQFRPEDDGRNWIGVDFTIPKPRATLGEPVRVEPESGDKAWIWTHHNKRSDGGLKGQGLVGIATIAAVMATSRDHVVVRFSDVNIRKKKLHRKEMERHKAESPIVAALIEATTSRSVALSPGQEVEFQAVVAAEDERFREQVASSVQNNSEAKSASADDGKEWSDSELRACLVAYLEMLGKELAGIEYRKSDFRRALTGGRLTGRTEPAVEFRMRNVSAFFADRDMPIIKGYLPAENVGSGVLDRLGRLYEELGGVDHTAFSPTDDEDSLVARSSKLTGLNGIFSPIGNKKPVRSTSTREEFIRDPAVIGAVLYHANGRCENCGSSAPFRKEDGSPFLEVHHVRFLSDGGPDTVCNAVALCPNCHRACHHSSERDELRRKLLDRVPRLINHWSV